MKFLLAAINAKYIHSNLAVYSLKEYALSKITDSQNPEIIICEYTINNLLDDILEDIYSKKPDMIGFSCYIWNISYIDALIPELKKLLPNTRIWCGGPEVSYRAEDYMSKFPEIISGVMAGEGEAAFYKLVSDYSKGNIYDLSHIRGLVYYDAGGHITDTGMPVNISLDEIPFIYNSVNIGDFEHRIIYYESSRGCPFSCSYCLSSIDKCIRYRSLTLVKQELQFFLDSRVPQVKFIDRTFNCCAERSYEIWKYIYENDNGITNFHFEIAGDLLNDSQIELLSKFRPGLVQFEIGVQSTNISSLNEIHRVSNLDKLSKNVAKIRNGKNIHQHLDLIAGLPYEALESFKNSFNQVYAMAPDQLQLGFLKVLSGSYMKEHAGEYGIVYRSYPPYEVLYTNCLSHDDILLLKQIETVVEIYYNTHQFDYSIGFLERFFASPFDLFAGLGSFYCSHFDTKAKHSRISRYKLLMEFRKTLNTTDCVYAPIQLNCLDTNGNVVIKELSLDYPELLTLDLYLRENMKSRPDFACDLSKYHKNITEYKRRYSLSNHEHIEVFECRSNNKKEYVYIHFNYEKRDALTHDAELTIL